MADDQDSGWVQVGAPKKKTSTAPKTSTAQSPLNTKAATKSSYSPSSSSSSSYSKPSSSSSGSYGSSSSNVVQKYGAGTNKKATTVNAKKIEEEAESGEGSLSIKKIDRTISVNIQRERTAKGWTQKDLAKIRDYENGQATPTGTVLAKMEKVFGTKLR